MRARLQTAAMVLAAAPVLLCMALFVAIPLRAMFLSYLVDYALVPCLLSWGVAGIIIAAHFWNEENRVTNTALVTLVFMALAPFLGLVLLFIAIFGYGMCD